MKDAAINTSVQDLTPIDGHVGCFYLLTIVNNAAMNIGVQIFVQSPCFQSFWIYTKKWNCWDHTTILILGGNWHTVSHSSYSCTGFCVNINFQFSGKMPKTAMVGSYDKQMYVQFCKKLQTIIQSGYTILYFHHWSSFSASS